MIGLSLSFCIGDILAGEVSLGDVDVIYSGTMTGHVLACDPACDDDTHFEEVIDDLARVYWKADPEQGKDIARALRQSGRIIEPKRRGHEPFNVSKGHWTSADKLMRLIAAADALLDDIGMYDPGCDVTEHPHDFASFGELTAALERAFRP